MRLLITRCEVVYDGALSSYLPPAWRLVMVKADGCVAVHADGGAYKPLNWMNAPNDLRTNDDGSHWTVVGRNGERLEITFHETVAEHDYQMGEDPGLVKDGVEAHLQQLLAEHPDVLGDGLRLERREHPTGIGPVDLLCRDASGEAVAVEIKRRGEIDGVEQLTRYLDRLNQDPLLRPVRGVLAAQEVRPQARTLAEDRGIWCVEVDLDELRGRESRQPRLF